MGYRNYQLAQYIGVSEARLSRIITGRTEAAPHERARIAAFLNMDEAWLFRAIVPPGRNVAATRETATLSMATVEAR